jgi:aminomethyltransferase
MTDSGARRWLSPTPLHGRTAEACLANDWTAEGRFLVARAYRSAAEEAAALTARAGLADISPLVKYRISGKGGEAALDHLCATRIAGLESGEARRVLWCDDDGFVLGDGTLLRLSAQHFFLFTRLPCLAWLEDAMAPFAVRVEDVSAALAGVGLLGPVAQEVLTAAGFGAAAKLAQDRGGALACDGHDVIAMRAPLDMGLDLALWATPSAAPLLWDRLSAAGAPLGLVPVGAAALETARLEAGTPKLGLDYHPASRVVPPEVAASPYALGLGALVDLRKQGFVGRAALADLGDEPQTLIRLAVASGDVAPGQRVLAQGRSAGFTTSSAYSLRQQCSLAFAWLARASAGQALAVALPPTLGKGAEPRLAKAHLAPTETANHRSAAGIRHEPPALNGPASERPAPPGRAASLS